MKQQSPFDQTPETLRAFKRLEDGETNETRTLFDKLRENAKPIAGALALTGALTYGALEFNKNSQPPQLEKSESAEGEPTWVDSETGETWTQVTVSENDTYYGLLGGDSEAIRDARAVNGIEPGDLKPGDTLLVEEKTYEAAQDENQE